MIVSLKSGNLSAVQQGTVVSQRCPSCRQLGTFQVVVGNLTDLHFQDNVSAVFLGQRCCPNPSCRAHVFFVYCNVEHKILASYPPERIGFDTTEIPKPIVAAFEEAITCHANQCFVAAAIMVRKTLEELCADRGVEGDNLWQRIRAVGKMALLPADLFNGLDAIRLLGNDAAHVDLKDYANVEQEDVEIAIDFTKEVLKAVYQHAALVQRMKARKKTNQV